MISHLGLWYCQGRLMKLFGEALEKRASVCYTFHIFHAESVARECLPHLYFPYLMGLKL
jgi:hypothetical protein